MRSLPVLAIVASAYALLACTSDTSVTPPAPDAGSDVTPAPETDAGADAADECDEDERVAAFVDDDRDGYGTLKAGLMCSPLPSGFATTGGDCDDDNPLAHPGQPDFQAGAVAGELLGDFNCDGVEEQEVTTLGSCDLSGEGADCADGTTHDFWYAVVPHCGYDGTWINTCGPFQDNHCARDLEVRPQRCR